MLRLPCCPHNSQQSWRPPGDTPSVVALAQHWSILQHNPTAEIFRDPDGAVTQTAVSATPHMHDFHGVPDKVLRNINVVTAMLHMQ